MILYFRLGFMVFGLITEQYSFNLTLYSFIIRQRKATHGCGNVNMDA